ncbi:NAD(P)-binding protein [Wolfiporia cocos MD-104 SS10]|uniref:NAD(P)-binding protein n=1 Tax=Wolfiporia cocos (strain MD-104) TaxID=742152 RepID=A0A2H3JJ92_WOLCO|nr:NAD(P)-binding protein [Wolfiporia cocos MD-104 SS10]
MAKAKGLRVIASAGSDEKVVFIKSLGAGVTFNYKTENTRDILAWEGPINMYWDSVGGEALEVAIGAASVGARFIECGMISIFTGEPYHVKNLFNIDAKGLKISGFIVSSLSQSHQSHFYEMFLKLVKEGKHKYKEDVTKGLERAGHTIIDVITGRNKGKSMILVGEE